MDKSKTSPPRPRWPSRSNITIFIKTLHLLDLDLLPDWPGITESTFSSSSNSGVKTPSTSTAPAHAQGQTQNLQQRIKAVEWSLYRLFEVYDKSTITSNIPSVTGVANFPPTTPMQSLQLRASLYRALTELKRKGVLAREIVLRKTMLDECRGDKFEELLGGFALVVLRRRCMAGTAGAKLAKQRKGEKENLALGRSVMALSTSLTANHDPANVVPLIIAHRVSLQRSLQRRQDVRDKAATYSKVLAQARNDVSTKHLQISSQPDTEEIDTNAASLEDEEEERDSLRSDIARAFIADQRWTTYIFDGDASSPLIGTSTLADLQWPFNEDNDDEDQDNHARIDPHAHANANANAPMEQLQRLISQHEERIARLRRVRESLSPSSSELDAQQQQPLSPVNQVQHDGDRYKSTPRFNRHQPLSLKSVGVM